MAHSIADRPGLASGRIGGMIAASIDAGFIGGTAAGFLAGYTVKFRNDKIQLQASWATRKVVWHFIAL